MSWVDCVDLTVSTSKDAPQCKHYSVKVKVMSTSSSLRNDSMMKGYMV